MLSCAVWERVETQLVCVWGGVGTQRVETRLRLGRCGWDLSTGWGGSGSWQRVGGRNPLDMSAIPDCSGVWYVYAEHITQIRVLAQLNGGTWKTWGASDRPPRKLEPVGPPQLRGSDGPMKDSAAALRGGKGTGQTMSKQVGRMRDCPFFVRYYCQYFIVWDAVAARLLGRVECFVSGGSILVEG